MSGTLKRCFHKDLRQRGVDATPKKYERIVTVRLGEVQRLPLASDLPEQYGRIEPLSYAQCGLCCAAPARIYYVYTYTSTIKRLKIDAYTKFLRWNPFHL